jgi:hypothetical protein
MAQPFKIARNHESTLYVPRIQALLDTADLRGARSLLAEARERGATEPELDKLAEILAPPTFKLSPGRSADRSAEIQWLREHWRDYRGQWVAVMGHELVGHAVELQDLMKQLRAETTATPALLQYIED